MHARRAKSRNNKMAQDGYHKCSIDGVVEKAQNRPRPSESRYVNIRDSESILAGKHQNASHVCLRVSAHKFDKTGVAQNYSFDVNFSTGLADGGERVAKWVLRNEIHGTGTC